MALGTPAMGGPVCEIRAELGLPRLGSMTPADAGRLSELAVAAGRQAGVRTVIQSGLAGLTQADQADDLVVIGDVPHDRLFPEMAAVVHHAGAGTTAAGLRAGYRP